MWLHIHCKYCPREFTIVVSDEVSVPTRGFKKVNCPSCNSRMELDVAIRAKGKSTSIKKGEAKRKQVYDDCCRAVFETTEAAGSGATWLGLNRYEKDNFKWRYHEAINKKFEEAGYKR